MEPISPEFEKYAANYVSQTDSLLVEIEQYTRLHHAEAHMISGMVQGKVLEMLSLMIRPENILEIGTFTGFSALCLAKGLAEHGRLHTIEIRKADADTAESFFKRSEYRNRISLHVGNALDIIPQLPETWDLVFLDADKTGYIDYYELTLPRIKKGGWLLADNVLFHGSVLENPVKGRNGKAIQAFNDHVKSDDRVEHVLMTIRDGLMLVRKK